METSVELEKLADEVAKILDERDGKFDNAKVLASEVVLLVGATYLCTKLYQKVMVRRYKRKLGIETK